MDEKSIDEFTLFDLEPQSEVARQEPSAETVARLSIRATSSTNTFPAASIKPVSAQSTAKRNRHLSPSVYHRLNPASYPNCLLSRHRLLQTQKGTNSSLGTSPQPMENWLDEQSFQGAERQMDRPLHLAGLETKPLATELRQPGPVDPWPPCIRRKPGQTCLIH
jgi:hypothetical protein